MKRLKWSTILHKFFLPGVTADGREWIFSELGLFEVAENRTNNVVLFAAPALPYLH